MDIMDLDLTNDSCTYTGLVDGLQCVLARSRKLSCITRPAVTGSACSSRWCSAVTCHHAAGYEIIKPVQITIIISPLLPCPHMRASHGMSVAAVDN